ncbi:restriction endonuclease subunit S [Mycolicibacterium boenickei]
MKTVALGEVLTATKTPIRVNDPTSAKLISVKLYGRGAVRREIGDGKAPKPFTGNLGRTGQFVFSRIWARRGAMALIPPELDGVVVTNEFPLFDVELSKVDPTYLVYYVQTEQFLGRLEGASAGASGQNRVKEAAFLALPIPLPPINEQRRIAAILTKADSLRARRQQTLKQVDGLAQSIFTDMFGEPSAALHSGQTVRFGQLANLQGGRNLVAEDDQAESPYRVLKISSVTSGEFKPAESKPLPLDYRPPEDHLVRQGDLLMSRANTAELVGAVAYVHECPSNLALPDKIWRFVWRDPESVPLYYWALFRNPSIRSRISRLSSGTGGSMKNISKAKLDQLELPRASTSSQRDFARRLGAIPKPRTRELDELFASLQSRAFRGEL